MAWCCQATSHYLSQWWPRSLWPYSVTRPQWVNHLLLLRPPWARMTVQIPTNSGDSPSRNMWAAWNDNEGTVKPGGLFTKTTQSFWCRDSPYKKVPTRDGWPLTLGPTLDDKQAHPGQLIIPTDSGNWKPLNVLPAKNSGIPEKTLHTSFVTSSKYQWPLLQAGEHRPPLLTKSPIHTPRRAHK